MNNPKISVIIPVFNVENYLHDCIDSIINQSFESIEIICINDGSADASLEILNNFALKDDRIQIINKPCNEGTLLARKLGVLQSKGKYIVFVDSDDLFSSIDSLQTIYQLIEAENVDILQYDIEIMSIEGEYQHSDDWNKVHLNKLVGDREIISACIDNRYNWCLWNKIYRADVCIQAFQSMKDVYLITAEDCYTYMLIAHYAKTFLGIHTQPIYTYRQGTGVTSFNNLDLNRFEIFCKENLICQWLRDFFYAKENMSSEEKIYYDTILNKLSQRFFEHCFFRLGQIPQEYNVEASQILCKYFSAYEVFSFMMQKLNVQAIEP